MGDMGCWCQMVFYLSLTEAGERQATLAGLHRHLGSRPQELRQRFAPVMEGLRQAAAGTLLRPGANAGSPRAFLGWSLDPHWLLPPQPR